jgi:cell division protein FtsN
MRIDYSEPKKSCSSPLPSHNRPRKESSGGVLAVIFITAVLSLGIGFGSGWTLSQRSARKAFKAAMEQQSLENSPQQAKAHPSQQQPRVPAPLPAVTQQPQTGVSAPQPAAAGETHTAVDPPLSFYKTLPSGQKNNAIGSGINSKDEKPAKQPLQAAMPANMTRPEPNQNDESTQKQSLPAVTPKPAVRQDSSGYTVQVASYSLKSEAETLRNSLAAKGYNVGIVESHLGEKGTWYRVRVGKRLDPDAAKELAKKLGKGAMAIPDRE